MLKMGALQCVRVLFTSSQVVLDYVHPFLVVKSDTVGSKSYQTLDSRSCPTFIQVYLLELFLPSSNVDM